MKLAPETANIERDGMVVTVGISEVKPGDIFVVKPGESIPVDGKIIEGETAVDASALTGESVPVDKEQAILSAPQQSIRQASSASKQRVSVKIRHSPRSSTW